jgi:hypothetical protein
VLTASRLGAPRVQKKKANDFPGRTDGTHTLATHTAMIDPGGPAGPAVPPPALLPQCGRKERTPPRPSSRSSRPRNNKEQRLEQNAARMVEISAAAAAARAAEEAECRRILEDKTVPIISALAALRRGGMQRMVGGSLEASLSHPGDARSPRRVWTLHASRKNRSFKKKLPKKLGSGWRQGFRKYERAGERHERAQAVGLGFGGRACIRLSERASLQLPADERAWPMSSIQNLSWPVNGGSKSQLRSIRSLNWPANRSSLKRPIRKFEIE